MVNCKYSRLTVLAIGLAIGPFHFVEPLTILVHISEAHVSLPVILYCFKPLSHRFYILKADIHSASFQQFNLD